MRSDVFWDYKSLGILGSNYKFDPAEQSTLRRSSPLSLPVGSSHTAPPQYENLPHEDLPSSKKLGLKKFTKPNIPIFRYPAKNLWIRNPQNGSHFPDGEDPGAELRYVFESFQGLAFKDIQLTDREVILVQKVTGVGVLWVCLSNYLPSSRSDFSWKFCHWRAGRFCDRTSPDNSHWKIYSMISKPPGSWVAWG